MSENNQELLREHHDQEEHWISVSDLMAGLMMIFLLIAIIYMIRVEVEKDRIQEVAILYNHLKNELYKDLKREFQDDLDNWGAEIHKDLTIRFKEPTILFGLGEYKLKKKFKEILHDFFPRYVSIITSEKYRDSITEVRIEGHTSSIWGKNTSEENAYFLNMSLSQARTRTTLRYLLGISKVKKQLFWLRMYMTANGLSSSRLIYDENGNEDFARSQRVEFRIINNAEARIAKILEIN